ncbi:MAG: hypothetical protein EWM72_00553 [Nitrospira sp.]|nr:MAG: hypothetical protein EWM72_00553 [Nitrospira sp.]
MREKLLRHFPHINTAHAHRNRDYFIAVCTFLCVTVSSICEVSASIEKQHDLGVIAWVLLGGLLLGENRETRMQVVIAVAFATIGEHFASLYMGGYTYRLENVPAYVPPGHGMVYLTAIALARSGLFVRYARGIAACVVLVWGAWSMWGISGYAEQGDALGAVMFCVFLACLFAGRSPMVYVAAFFITTWLELIGTAVGAWKWAAIDPVLGLSQGNPPSGVAVWYCLVDAVAIGGAAPLLRGLKHAGKWCKYLGSSPKRAGGCSISAGHREHAREDVQAPIRLTSQAIHRSLRNQDLVVESRDKT